MRCRLIFSTSDWIVSPSKRFWIKELILILIPAVTTSPGAGMVDFITDLVFSESLCRAGGAAGTRVSYSYHIWSTTLMIVGYVTRRDAWLRARAQRSSGLKLYVQQEHSVQWQDNAEKESHTLLGLSRMSFSRLPPGAQSSCSSFPPPSVLPPLKCGHWFIGGFAVEVHWQIGY